MRRFSASKPETPIDLSPQDQAIAHEIFEYWKHHGRAVNWHVAARHVVKMLRNKGYLKSAENDNKTKDEKHERIK